VAYCRANYGKFEPVNIAKIFNFHKYCHWFGFCDEVDCDMFRDRLGVAFWSSEFAIIIYHDVLAETLSFELFVFALLTRSFCFYFC
jgi:hypothetical protein